MISITCECRRMIASHLIGTELGCGMCLAPALAHYRLSLTHPAPPWYRLLNSYGEWQVRCLPPTLP